MASPASSSAESPASAVGFAFLGAPLRPPLQPSAAGAPLAAFLLGLRAPLDPLTGGRLRREPVPAGSPGREAATAEIAGLLAAPTRLPLVVAGPDAAALVAHAAGRPLLLCDVRDLSKPEVVADAALCCALEGRLLCADGLERPEPGAPP